MGVSALGDICKGLMEHGMEPEMPAAILQKGTTAAQKRIVATVGTLEAETIRQGVETPAIIVVGKVCTLADEFDWYGKLPLAGRKILVTRPKELISQMAEKLRKKGAEVLELPAIRTTAICPNEPLEEAFAQIGTYDWIVFTSPTGVRIFFDAMKEAGVDIRHLTGAKFAVIGSGTAKALKERGLFYDLMPEVYDGASLGRALAKVCQPGERVLIPRAAIGNQELITELKKVGDLSIHEVSTYDTFYESQTLVDERAEFEEGRIDCAVFTSASTVRGFSEAVKGIDFQKVRAVCIGKQTKAAADALGMETYMAERATMDSVVACVEKLFEK
jgi:uroporphyrinogen III methyltransferase/synthase